MLPMAFQVLDVITTWNEKLSRIERAIAYIEQTQAADLNYESIGEASK